MPFQYVNKRFADADYFHDIVQVSHLYLPHVLIKQVIWTGSHALFKGNVLRISNASF